jgi:undecaprenyl-diphosphatase
MNNPLFVQQMVFVSGAGDKTYLVPMIAFGSILFFYFNAYRRESLLMTLAAMSILFAYLLKLIFRQARPETANKYYFFDIYSFPSSHTLSYTVIFGFLIYLAFKLTGIALPLRIVTVLVSAYFICIVGISRVYLGQHYIWDVAAGYIFGLLFLVGLILLENQWR